MARMQLESLEKFEENKGRQKERVQGKRHVPVAGGSVRGFYALIGCAKLKPSRLPRESSFPDIDFQQQ